MDTKRVIGAKGYLPWKIKEDLRWFRKITTDNTIVMGRATWQGILEKHGPLFPRRYVVVLSKAGGTWEGAQTVRSVKALVDLAMGNKLSGKVIIAGGAQVFAETMPHIETMYLTKIKATYEGDTYMPPFESEFPYDTLQETHETCTMHLLSRSPVADADA